MLIKILLLKEKMLSCLKQFSLIVLLRLHDEGVLKAKCVSDLFHHNITDLSRSVGEEVGIKEGEGVLFVFDGFDEFPAKLRKSSLVLEVISGLCLPKSKVLVTSRPSTKAELRLLSQAATEKE